MKKLLLSLIALSFIFSLTGCVKEKKFKKEDFEITLTEEFEEKEQEKMTYFFKSDSVGVAILKEKFENLKIIELDENSPLEDYKNIVVRKSKNSNVKKEKDFYYYSYISTINNVTYYYFTAMFKGKDAFWLVNFFTLKENAKKLEKEFLKYAKSVQIKTT